MPFSDVLRCKIVREAPAYLKGFIFALFLVPDLRVGDASAQLHELNIMGLTEPWSIYQVATLNCQGKVNIVTIMGSKGKAVPRIA